MCAQWTTAPIPSEPMAGYGPRVTALVGEIAGTHGTGGRTIQALCASGLQVPLRLEALQKMLARVAYAIAPHEQAIASHARQPPVNDIEETRGC